MQKEKKRFFGLVSLFLVIAMTIVAYYIPAPDAAAEGSSVSETIRVVVYDQYPEVEVLSPESGSVLVSPSFNLNLKYENSSVVHLTLKYQQTNESTGEVEMVEIPLEDFTPSDLDEMFNYASGETPYNIDLSTINSGLPYGHYYLELKSESPIGYDEANIEFYYAPAMQTETGVEEESGDPIVSVAYDEGVKKVALDIYDEKGNKISEEPIIIENTDSNLAGGEKKGIVLPLDSYGLESGKYIIKLTAYDENGNLIESPLPEGTLTTFTINYKKPEAPTVPDTGRFLTSLGISKTDYVITGVLAFSFITFFALAILGKKQKKDYRKNLRNRK